MNMIRGVAEGPGARAYQTILQRLRAGEVTATDRLVDTALAAELSISRMPVREALLRLVHEGYLVGTTRGFSLPSLSREDIIEIFEVRRMLEPRAAAAAVVAIDDYGLAALSVALVRAKSAAQDRNAAELSEANVSFRRTWLDATPNQRLAGTIARFVDHVQMIRSATMEDPTTQQIVVRLLERMHGAFLSRDTLMVYDLMGKFIDTAQQAFFDLTVAEDAAIANAQAAR
ncbi:GntR family transcriptional regulator [Novosphingobium sp. P6W]|uniref:GntR family transcriptional regulator n=1 Tax=Novosphingobium sp. P6W TaxID=1609758 RepID=UPI000697E828|nr:GntR family transcriptional regulator [Novosphingobium sp. P6W]